MTLVLGMTVASSDAQAGGVPEPSAWALMIAGFGLTGAALRRRRAAVALA
ncbi:MAG: PEP-CTERM sorting domain-containing protein [Phenylobacterium sp.]|nr:MAG: PEP-CTERM sorting domain-containing protein [Phenylobacterium sp.]